MPFAFGKVTNLSSSSLGIVKPRRSIKLKINRQMNKTTAYRLILLNTNDIKFRQHTATSYITLLSLNISQRTTSQQNVISNSFTIATTNTTIYCQCSYQSLHSGIHLANCNSPIQQVVAYNRHVYYVRAMYTKRKHITKTYKCLIFFVIRNIWF